MQENLNVDTSFHRVTLNALNFLRLATLDQFNRPTQMAIRVYTAVELILKARLLHEHWTLIVNKNPSRAAFEAGDFVSVTFEEACKRLSDAILDPVPPKARQSFDALRKLRNLIVHFVPPEGEGLMGRVRTDAEMRKIAMAAWGALHNLMGNEWKPVFEPYFAELDRIEQTLGVDRESKRAPEAP